MIQVTPADPARVLIPSADQPRVSVIVLAWRHEDLLRECLASIVAAGGHSVPYEVVIVLNGASPAVVRLVEHEIVGATIVRSRVNRGFAGGCNLARRHARGEFLLLVNDDIEVDPGWMEGLVQTLDDHPDAGAVGSRVLSADGLTLQEAGSLLSANGSPLGVGRGVPESEHRYMSLRTVPYCSGCSLLVRASSWDAVGGLDERYFPAYFEDVDLCLSLRQIGQRVLYQPISRVRHHESASLDDAYRNFAFHRAKAAFVEKWQLVLPKYPKEAHSQVDLIVRGQRGARHVLVVDDQLPNLTSGSGFGRMHDTVTELLRNKWAPTVFASNTLGADPRPLGGIGVEVLEGDLVHHLEALPSSYDAVIISRPNNFERFAHHVRLTQPGAPIVYDSEALYHRRFGRQLDLAEEGGVERQIRSERDYYLAIESSIATSADAVVSISEDEADFFRSTPGHATVEVRPPMFTMNVPGPNGFSERRDLVMVAGWLAGASSPNGDGLRWFVRTVLPIVRARHPWVRLYVTGADPPSAIQALASPNVTFLGNVTNLGTLHDSVRIAISPIRYGAGVKLKVVDGLRYGVPVVSTTVGADGLPPSVQSAVRISDDPRTFAEHVLDLLEHEKSWSAARASVLEARKAIEGQPKPWNEILMAARRSRRLETAR